MRVIREIATGGYGRVEEVLHNGERYARKTFDESLQPLMTPQQRQTAKLRFIREVKIQAQLDHPHLVPIVEHDLDQDPPWFLMPLATESFCDRIERDRQSGIIDLNALLEILAALVAGQLHTVARIAREADDDALHLLDRVRPTLRRLDRPDHRVPRGNARRCTRLHHGERHFAIECHAAASFTSGSSPVSPRGTRAKYLTTSRWVRQR